MSDIRYYADEHVAKAVVVGLRQRGIDALTAAEAGMRGASDQQHLAFARSAGRVMFTQDDDFLRLAARGEPHAGIVDARQPASIGRIVRGLEKIHKFVSAQGMVGRVEYL